MYSLVDQEKMNKLKDMSIETFQTKIQVGGGGWYIQELWQNFKG